MLCMTLGVYAQPNQNFEIKEGKWWCTHADPNNVTIINVQEGHLADAINELLTSEKPHIQKCREHKILRITNYKPGNNVDLTVTLNADDIAALNSLNNFGFETIDLQDVQYLVDGKQTAFTFSNGTVKNLILPDGWTKDEVRTIGSRIGVNLGSAISQGVNELNEPTMVAHVEKGNTLAEAVSHLFIDEIPNKKLGSSTENNSGITQYNHSMCLLRHLTVSGHPVARDLCNGKSTFDENGHYEFNAPADETSTQSFAAVGGGTRELVGTQQDGAFTDLEAKLISLDLSSVEIEDEYNEDLIVLNLTGVFGAPMRTMQLPTYAGFNTIPADFFKNNMSNFRQICIPGNIMYIKTRAFTMQSLDHVWTTGNDPNTVYDNGVYLKNETEPRYGILPRDVKTVLGTESDVLYGTYTLPANLKLIESHAFKQDQSHVKDVYSLSIDAPECHVDAFGANFYHANNTISGEPVDGIITREAYSNGKDDGTYVTMLHYPRECVTPAIQRYTDVTREYSVATGERDGKGATIYYPNQTEMMRAYTQGTYGYLWYAWDPTRDPYTNAIQSAGEFGTWTQGGQETANQAYESNTNTDPSKTDRSFYDVTAGGNLSNPSGLEPYYNTIWLKTQLYPQPETAIVTNSDGTPVMKTVPATDENGNILYDAATGDEGEYKKIGTYTKDNGGAYVQDVTATANNSGSYVRDYEYVKVNYDPNSGETYYFHDAGYTVDNNGLYTNEYVFTQDDNGIWRKDHRDDIGDFYRTRYWDGEAGPGYTVSIIDGKYKLWKGDETEKNLIAKNAINRYSEYDNGIQKYTDTSVAADEYYIKVYSNSYRAYNPETDGDEQRYDVTFGGYREYAGTADDNLQRYAIAESYVEKATALEANQIALNEGTTYIMQMTEVPETYITKKHDYRGWHQFTLTAYATNSKEEFVPYRTYITDNDWWTICIPFDLTKSDMITLFGDKDNNKIPYLSKLTYVVRDVENKQIVLTFSKNLLTNKEVVEGNNVHGQITTGTVADDDIVLHAGVPYLIRPNLHTDDNGKVDADRQFDIKKIDNESLYNRIHASEELSGSAMNELIYKGIYTVPAYVVNDNGTESVTNDPVSFTQYEGPTFTYNNSDEIVYNKKTTTGKLSTDFCYSFVGSFFLSKMPQYSYFLGWDSKKNKAAFWYNKVPDQDKFTWNNETGIILPNWITTRHNIYNPNEEGKGIDPASGLDDPARWIITLSNGDDFATSTGGAKNYTNESQFGYQAPLWSDEATVIIRIDDDNVEQPVNGVKGVFNMSGQYMGESTEGLQKGIYVVNGKKMVVK